MTPKVKQALRLYASGMDSRTISEELKISQKRLWNILGTKEAKEFLDKFYRELDEYFKNQYLLVINSIRDGLLDPEIKTRLEASTLWLKAHGKFSQKVEVKVGAEEQVEKMLYQEEVIDADPALPEKSNQKGN